MAKQKKILVFLLAIGGFHPILATSSEYIGDRECFACHKDVKKVYLADAHGRKFTKNPSNNLEKLGCESCHGPGLEHKDIADREEKGLLKIESFKVNRASPDAINAPCLKCHKGGSTLEWQGSAHNLGEINCTDCHKIHSGKSIDKTNACLKCHTQKRAQLQRSSHLPLRERKMDCASCHNPHGGKGPSLLKSVSVNESCYGCHAEIRGPFLWEHSPVREDCSSCHESHGSNYPSLLKMKVPYLCQSCHASLLPHSRDIYDNGDITSSNPSRFMFGKSCLNCHSLIHGSNHPSGAKLTR